MHPKIAFLIQILLVVVLLLSVQACGGEATPTS